jgi:hypothetical protein
MQAGFEEAITACQDSAALCRVAGDRPGEGIALGNLSSAGLITHLARDVGVVRGVLLEAGAGHDQAAAIASTPPPTRRATPPATSPTLAARPGPEDPGRRPGNNAPGQHRGFASGDHTVNRR